MASRQDRDTRPSKVDACDALCNTFSSLCFKKASKHCFYEDYVLLRNQLLLLEYDEDDPSVPSKLFDMTEMLRRYIEDAPQGVRQSVEFVKDIHRKLLFLHENICKHIKVNHQYPLAQELHLLLVRYVELEYEMLYNPQNYSAEYQKRVENRVLSLLLTMLYSPLTKRGQEKLAKSAADACAMDALYVMKSVKPEYKKQQSLIENMMIKVLRKLNVLDKVNEMRSKNKTLNLDKLLQVPQVQKVYEYLRRRDYDTDDLNTSEDELEEVTEQFVTPVKREEKYNVEEKVDVSSFACYNVQRKVMTIDLDDDEEDCYMIYFHPEVQKPDKKEKKYALDGYNVQTTARTTSNISDRFNSYSELNSFTTSETCDIKPFSSRCPTSGEDIIVIDDSDSDVEIFEENYSPLINLENSSTTSAETLSPAHQDPQAKSQFAEQTRKHEIATNISPEFEDALLQCDDISDNEIENEEEILNKYSEDADDAVAETAETGESRASESIHLVSAAESVEPQISVAAEVVPTSVDVNDDNNGGEIHSCEEPCCASNGLKESVVEVANMSSDECNSNNLQYLKEVEGNSSISVTKSELVCHIGSSGTSEPDEVSCNQSTISSSDVFIFDASTNCDTPLYQQSDNSVSMGTKIGEGTEQLTIENSVEDIDERQYTDSATQHLDESVHDTVTSGAEPSSEEVINDTVIGSFLEQNKCTNKGFSEECEFSSDAGHSKALPDEMPESVENSKHASEKIDDATVLEQDTCDNNSSTSKEGIAAPDSSYILPMLCKDHNRVTRTDVEQTCTDNEDCFIEETVTAEVVGQENVPGDFMIEDDRNSSSLQHEISTESTSESTSIVNESNAGNENQPHDTIDNSTALNHEEITASNHEEITAPNHEEITAPNHEEITAPSLKPETQNQDNLSTDEDGQENQLEPKEPACNSISTDVAQSGDDNQPLSVMLEADQSVSEKNLNCDETEQLSAFTGVTEQNYPEEVTLSTEQAKTSESDASSKTNYDNQTSCEDSEEFVEEYDNTFPDHSCSNNLDVLASVAAEQQKMEDAVLVESKRTTRSKKSKKINKNEKKQTGKRKVKTIKSEKSETSNETSEVTRRITRSSVVRKQRCDTKPSCFSEIHDQSKCIPSAFMNLENLFTPPPIRVYNLIPDSVTDNEESLDEPFNYLDTCAHQQSLGELSVKNPVFDENTVEDGIVLVYHKKQRNSDSEVIISIPDSEKDYPGINYDILKQTEEFVSAHTSKNADVSSKNSQESLDLQVSKELSFLSTVDNSKVKSVQSEAPSNIVFEKDRFVGVDQQNVHTENCENSHPVAAENQNETKPADSFEVEQKENVINDPGSLTTNEGVKELDSIVNPDRVSDVGQESTKVLPYESVTEVPCEETQKRVHVPLKKDKRRDLFSKTAELVPVKKRKNYGKKNIIINKYEMKEEPSLEEKNLDADIKQSEEALADEENTVTSKTTERAEHSLVFEESVSMQKRDGSLEHTSVPFASVMHISSGSERASENPSDIDSSENSTVAPTTDIDKEVTNEVEQVTEIDKNGEVCKRSTSVNCEVSEPKDLSQKKISENGAFVNEDEQEEPHAQNQTKIQQKKVAQTAVPIENMQKVVEAAHTLVEKGAESFIMSDSSVIDTPLAEIITPNETDLTSHKEHPDVVDQDARDTCKNNVEIPSVHEPPAENKDGQLESVINELQCDPHTETGSHVNALEIRSTTVSEKISGSGGSEQLAEIEVSCFDRELTLSTSESSEQPSEIKGCYSDMELTYSKTSDNSGLDKTESSESKLPVYNQVENEKHLEHEASDRQNWNEMPVLEKEVALNRDNHAAQCAEHKEFAEDSYPLLVAYEIEAVAEEVIESNNLAESPDLLELPGAEELPVQTENITEISEETEPSTDKEMKRSYNEAKTSEENTDKTVTKTETHLLPKSKATTDRVGHDSRGRVLTKAALKSFQNPYVHLQKLPLNFDIKQKISELYKKPSEPQGDEQRSRSQESSCKRQKRDHRSSSESLKNKSEGVVNAEGGSALIVKKEKYAKLRDHEVRSRRNSQASSSDEDEKVLKRRVGKEEVCGAKTRSSSQKQRDKQLKSSEATKISESKIEVKHRKLKPSEINNEEKPVKNKKSKSSTDFPMFSVEYEIKTNSDKKKAQHKKETQKTRYDKVPSGTNKVEKPKVSVKEDESKSSHATDSVHVISKSSATDKSRDTSTGSDVKQDRRISKYAQNKVEKMKKEEITDFFKQRDTSMDQKSDGDVIKMSQISSRSRRSSRRSRSSSSSMDTKKDQKESSGTAMEAEDFKEKPEKQEDLDRERKGIPDDKSKADKGKEVTSKPEVTSATITSTGRKADGKRYRSSRHSASRNSSCTSEDVMPESKDLEVKVRESKKSRNEKNTEGPSLSKTEKNKKAANGDCDKSKPVGPESEATSEIITDPENHIQRRTRRERRESSRNKSISEKEKMQSEIQQPDESGDRLGNKQELLKGNNTEVPVQIPADTVSIEQNSEKSDGNIKSKSGNAKTKVKADQKERKHNRTGSKQQTKHDSIAVSIDKTTSVIETDIKVPDDSCSKPQLAPENSKIRISNHQHEEKCGKVYSSQQESEVQSTVSSINEIICKTEKPENLESKLSETTVKTDLQNPNEKSTRLHDVQQSENEKISSIDKLGKLKSSDNLDNLKIEIDSLQIEEKKPITSDSGTVAEVPSKKLIEKHEENLKAKPVPEKTKQKKEKGKRRDNKKPAEAKQSELLPPENSDIGKKKLAEPKPVDVEVIPPIESSRRTKNKKHLAESKLLNERGSEVVVPSASNKIDENKSAEREVAVKPVIEGTLSVENDKINEQKSVESELAVKQNSEIILPTESSKVSKEKSAESEVSLNPHGETILPTEGGKVNRKKTVQSHPVKLDGDVMLPLKSSKMDKKKSATKEVPVIPRSEAVRPIKGSEKNEKKSAESTLSVKQDNEIIVPTKSSKINKRAFAENEASAKPVDTEIVSTEGSEIDTKKPVQSETSVKLDSDMILPNESSKMEKKRSADGDMVVKPLKEEISEKKSELVEPSGEAMLPIENSKKGKKNTAESDERSVKLANETIMTTKCNKMDKKTSAESKVLVKPLSETILLTESGKPLSETILSTESGKTSNKKAVATELSVKLSSDMILPTESKMSKKKSAEGEPLVKPVEAVLLIENSKRDKKKSAKSELSVKSDIEIIMPTENIKMGSRTPEESKVSAKALSEANLPLESSNLREKKCVDSEDSELKMSSDKVLPTESKVGQKKSAESDILLKPQIEEIRCIENNEKGKKRSTKSELPAKLINEIVTPTESSEMDKRKSADSEVSVKPLNEAILHMGSGEINKEKSVESSIPLSTESNKMIKKRSIESEVSVKLDSNAILPSKSSKIINKKSMKSEVSVKSCTEAILLTESGKTNSKKSDKSELSVKLGSDIILPTKCNKVVNEKSAESELLVIPLSQPVQPIENVEIANTKSVENELSDKLGTDKILQAKCSNTVGNKLVESELSEKPTDEAIMPTESSKITQKKLVESEVSEKSPDEDIVPTESEKIIKTKSVESEFSEEPSNKAIVPTQTGKVPKQKSVESELSVKLDSDKILSTKRSKVVHKKSTEGKLSAKRSAKTIVSAKSGAVTKKKSGESELLAKRDSDEILPTKRNKTVNKKLAESELSPKYTGEVIVPAESGEIFKTKSVESELLNSDKILPTKSNKTANKKSYESEILAKSFTETVEPTENSKINKKKSVENYLSVKLDSNIILSSERNKVGSNESEAELLVEPINEAILSTENNKEDKKNSTEDKHSAKPHSKTVLPAESGMNKKESNEGDLSELVNEIIKAAERGEILGQESAESELPGKHLNKATLPVDSSKMLSKKSTEGKLSEQPISEIILSSESNVDAVAGPLSKAILPTVEPSEKCKDCKAQSISEEEKELSNTPSEGAPAMESSKTAQKRKLLEADASSFQIKKSKNVSKNGDNKQVDIAHSVKLAQTTDVAHMGVTKDAKVEQDLVSSSPKKNRRLEKGSKKRDPKRIEYIIENLRSRNSQKEKVEGALKTKSITNSASHGSEIVDHSGNTKALTAQEKVPNCAPDDFIGTNHKQVVDFTAALADKSQDCSSVKNARDSIELVSVMGSPVKSHNSEQPSHNNILEFQHPTDIREEVIEDTVEMNYLDLDRSLSSGIPVTTEKSKERIIDAKCMEEEEIPCSKADIFAKELEMTENCRSQNYDTPLCKASEKPVQDADMSSDTAMENHPQHTSSCRSGNAAHQTKSTEKQILNSHSLEEAIGGHIAEPSDSNSNTDILERVGKDKHLLSFTQGTKQTSSSDVLESQHSESDIAYMETVEVSSLSSSFLNLRDDCYSKAYKSSTFTKNRNRVDERSNLASQLSKNSLAEHSRHDSLHSLNNLDVALNEANVAGISQVPSPSLSDNAVQLLTAADKQQQEEVIVNLSTSTAETSTSCETTDLIAVIFSNVAMCNNTEVMGGSEQNQSNKTGFIYFRGTDHNYHSVGDPLLGGECDSNESDHSSDNSKEIPTQELESVLVDDNILPYIPTLSENNQEPSSSLNESSVDSSTDFQLLEQCLIGNTLGRESSPPLPQTISCDNLYQTNLKQEILEYDDSSTSNNMEFSKENSEVYINQFQQQTMSVENMSALMSAVLTNIQNLNNMTRPTQQHDSTSKENLYQSVASEFSVASTETVQAKMAQNLDSNCNFAQMHETSSLYLHPHTQSSNMEYTNVSYLHEIPDTVSFETDFTNFYYLPVTQDASSVTNSISNKKVIVEHIPQYAEQPVKSLIELSKSSTSADIITSTVSSKVATNVSAQVTSASKHSQVSSGTRNKTASTNTFHSTPLSADRAKQISSGDSQRAASSVNLGFVRSSSRTRVSAPRPKKPSERKRTEERDSESNMTEESLSGSEVDVTVNKVATCSSKVKVKDDPSVNAESLKMERKQVHVVVPAKERSLYVIEDANASSGRKLMIEEKGSASDSKLNVKKSNVEQFKTKGVDVLNKPSVKKQENQLPKEESKLPKGVTGLQEHSKPTIVKQSCKTFQETLPCNTDKIPTESQNDMSPKKNMCLLKDAKSQTTQLVNKETQSKGTESYVQQVTLQSDMIDNVKRRKRKPVDYSSIEKLLENDEYESLRTAQRGRQKKDDVEDPPSKARPKRKLDYMEEKQAISKSKPYKSHPETDKNKSSSVRICNSSDESDTAAKPKNSIFEDSDDDIPKKKKSKTEGRLEPETMNALFDKLVQEGNINNIKPASGSKSSRDFTYENVKVDQQKFSRNPVDSRLSSVRPPISTTNIFGMESGYKKPDAITPVKQIGVVNPIPRPSNNAVRKEPPCNRSSYGSSEESRNSSQYYPYYSSNRNRRSYPYSSRESSRSSHQSSSRHIEYQSHSSDQRYLSQRSSSSSRSSSRSSSSSSSSRHHSISRSSTDQRNYRYTSPSDLAWREDMKKKFPHMFKDEVFF